LECHTEEEEKKKFKE